MYRDDHAATLARVETLQRELSEAQSGKINDQQRIAMLSAQLVAAQQALQRAGGAMSYPAGFGMPARGSTILVLGILSIVLCSILGPIAWSMGNEEMRRLDAGLVDPATRSSASAGRICGMIASILMIVSVVAVIAVFALIGTASRY